MNRGARQATFIALAVGLVLGLGPVISPLRAAAPATPPSVVLGAEGNRLWAYDPRTGDKQVVVRSNEDDKVSGLDINAQICSDPKNPRRFIAGEDTGQPNPPQGWGYFELHGDRVGELRATQLGKLTPTYAPGHEDNAENYGCGFLPGGQVITTDVGEQQPFAGVNGQLIVWFPPFTSRSIAYCKIDIAIATAGGAWVDGNDVLVAANRPAIPDAADLGGIYRYSGEWPTGPTAAEGCGRKDATGAPLVDEGRITKSLFIPGQPLAALVPSAIVPSPRGGWFVSSVLTGVIAEYEHDGTFVRRVLEPPLVETGQPPYSTGTPYGLAVDEEGSLWYADLGVVLSLPDIGPGDGNGTVRRIRFVDGEPLYPETMNAGLAFPDGMGVVPLTGAPAPPARTAAQATSAGRCGNWSMYGAELGRTFSTECPTSISPQSTPSLIPAWTVKTPKTVTASPVVDNGTVYVGDWSAQFYALRLSDGKERWRFQAEAAPGAAFGPIVSSAAVTDTGDRRLVIFGAGPRLYALDADTGQQVWVVDLSRGLAATPTEIESSPVVHEGVVYVGVDTHNKPEDQTGGVRGGLLAVGVVDGRTRWAFHPELDQPGVGCGGVWSSPVVDTVNRHVLIATGNCSATGDRFTWNRHTEAVTALRIDGDHGVAWTFNPHEPNRADIDFGATPNIITIPGTGQRLVGAGNKDGLYYAVDAATGKPVWQTKVAEPGNIDDGFAIGGFIGSPATWRGNVFGTTALGGPPWYHSLDGATGASRWSGVAGPSYAASAVVNGVVFAGDLTGTLKAFAADSGAPLGVWPLLGPISSGPAIAGDTVVIGSGTATTDVCAKEIPVAAECGVVATQTLGALGGIHAFRPARAGEPLLPRLHLPL